jgi:hypothetical protein
MRMRYLTLILLAACGGEEGGEAHLTYWRDVAPIMQAKCETCHRDGGIAPFALDTYAEAASRKNTIRDLVDKGEMPPWPPSDSCNDYVGDRSLSEDEKTTIKGWVMLGAVEGDKKDAPAPLDTPPGLPRVDQLLAMPEAYTPARSPDDYHCFLIDWPEAGTTYMTGLDIVPGDPEVVHHVILFLATPDLVPTYDDLDAAEAGPGYTCFGASGDLAYMIGGWVPGQLARQLPAGTGLEIQPGSKIVMQVHYNTNEKEPDLVSDITSVQFMLDDAVDKPGYMVPWVNPFWLNGGMSIPADKKDVVRSFSYDPTLLLSQLAPGLNDNTPFLIHSANLHMHLRGSEASLTIKRDSGDDTCLLEIPHWDFHWQGDYFMKQPVQFNPGDMLRIECHWDNSAENQPEFNGEQLPVETLNWGEGTTDEMCIGFVYVTGL